VTILIWTRSDGTRVELKSAADFADALAKIEAEADDAAQEGRSTDLALLNSSRVQLFEAWRKARREELESEQTHLTRVIGMLMKRIAWWQECASINDWDRPSDVSPAQAAIFAAGRSSPRSWDEARAALDWLPDYQVPAAPNLRAAIAQSEALLRAAKELQPLLDEFVSQLSERNFSDLRWADYRTKGHPAYVQAARAYNQAAERADG